MNKNRDTSEYEPTPLRITAKGRLILGATATAAVAITAAISMNHEGLSCSPGPESVQISENGTVWREAGIPLASELGISTREAMSEIAAVNPGIASLGEVDKWQSVILPVCEK